VDSRPDGQRICREEAPGRHAAVEIDAGVVGLAVDVAAGDAAVAKRISAGVEELMWRSKLYSTKTRKSSSGKQGTLDVYEPEQDMD
jgi:hypothetical protein